MRQVIVAFSEPDAAQKIRALLISRGLPVRGICTAGSQVLQMAALCEGGGVVVCPIRFGDMNAQEVMGLLPEDFDMLVLVTSRQQELIVGPGLFTLVQPANAAVIHDAVRQLLDSRQLRAARIGRPDQVHRPDGLPSDGLEPALHAPEHSRPPEEQKIIEQAKYLLMNRRRISEAEAHRYLQKRSMESGIRLLDLARKILLST
jgi:two-component system, response regulator PdtaR